MRITLVVNPVAGGGRAQKVVQVALPLLRSAGIKAEVLTCANGHEPYRLAREAAESGAELVVAVGGDGHASAVASGLLGTGCTLGLLPAGSANDYARSVGVPKGDVRAAVALLLRPRPQQLDVVRVESAAGVRHFLNVGGAGFDSVVAASAERIPFLRGAGRYVLGVLRELPGLRAGDFTMVADGARLRFRAMVVVLANGSTYGGGMKVAPGARLQSGRLEICIVGELSALAFLRAFPSVFRGTHVRHPAVTMLSASEVELAAEPAFEVTGDGELIGRLPARFKLLPAALPVAVGPAARLRQNA